MKQISWVRAEGDPYRNFVLKRVDSSIPGLPLEESLEDPGARSLLAVLSPGIDTFKYPGIDPYAIKADANEILHAYCDCNTIYNPWCRCCC
jgi:hypothetical protein